MKLFEQIAEERWSVRDLELARDEAESRAEVPRTRRRKKAAPSTKAPNVVELESELSQTLGTKVTIQEKKGRGTIRIDFYSTEDFEGIRQLLLAAPRKA